MTLHQTIRAYVPFTNKIEIITSSRENWRTYLSKNFLKVVDRFVKDSENLFCGICKRCHYTESALRNCIFCHKDDTIDNYIDHKLIRTDYGN